MQLPFYRSLRFKIIGLFTLLIFAGAVVGSLTSINLADREFRRVLHDQFHGTTGVVENFFNLVSQMALIWSAQISSDPELISALNNGQEESAIARLEELKQRARADSIIWLDRRGKVLHHSAAPEQHGNSLMSWRIVRSAVLEKQQDSSVVQDLGNFLIYSTGLLHDQNGKFSGALVLGYGINDELISQIKKNTHIDITIVRRRAVMASTFNTKTSRLSSIPLSYLEYQLLLGETNKVNEMRMGDTLYFTEAEPLKSMDQSMEGSILLTYPQSALDDIKERLVSRFAILSLAGFLIVALIGNTISIRLLNPIRQLIDRTNQISAGDLSSPINLKKRDEVGVLANDFNRMIEVIEGKNKALQSYTDNLELIVAERTEELERKKRSLSNAQRIAQMGSWSWNLETDALELSDEIYRLFDLKRDNTEYTFSLLIQTVHPDDRHILHRALRKAIRIGRVKPFSYRIRRPDGQIRIMQIEGEHFDGMVGRKGVIEGTVQDITERKMEEDTMQKRANFDSLTHLPNRNLFNDRLQQAWHVAHREKRTMALMFIDLDRFKWVNDSYGHDSGDDLLQQVSERLTACVREADTVARLGGDEFTAIFPEVVDKQIIERVAQRMLDRLAESFTLLGEHEVNISGSIGIALYPEDSENMDTLLKHADDAMYEAKKYGRNTYKYYSESVTNSEHQ